MIKTKIKKNYCFVSDFNFDLMTLDQQNEEFLNNFLEMGYVPNFTRITRPDAKAENGGTCIDNIFLKTTNLKSKACKYLTDLTDHYPLFVVQRKAKNKKSLWEFINKKLRGTESTNQKDLDYLMINGVKETCKFKIANEFNNFYSNVGTVLANKIEKPNDNLNLPKYNIKSIYLNPITYPEIIKTIYDLPEKTGGVDKIRVDILKKTAICIGIPLEHIFNKCILKSVWPSQLKAAEIVPIYKSGDKHLATNYRPISLISNIAKIFEKLIHSSQFLIHSTYS